MSSGQYRTPGVYVAESNAFPISVVDVATAIPLFIGYAEKAQLGDSAIWRKPVVLSSFAEFVQIFGGAQRGTLTNVTAGVPGADRLTYTGARYLLYDALRLFFDNGGGTCYVVAGAKFAAAGDVEMKGLWGDDIDEAMKHTAEPTMVVIPDATQLTQEAWKEVASKVIAHCAAMQSRIALLDVYGVDRTEVSGNRTQNQLVAMHSDAIAAIEMEFPSYGAVYYPWLETSVVPDSEVDFRRLEDTARVRLCLEIEREAATIYAQNTDELNAVQEIAQIVSDSTDLGGEDIANYHQQLTRVSPLYERVMKEVRRALNVLPPSAALAGVYTSVDNNLGVWKAPANVGLSSVVAPTIRVTHEDQQALSVPLNGRAINCIRDLPGRGVVVWGARTLDGNSLDWRYINVRRTVIMLEQSIKAALQAYVFEPNVPSTWMTVRRMIENYLTNKWQQGALVGAKPAEAFSVQVGLGSTMTANDVLDGCMHVSVQVAISRPAEFIVLTLVQQMQTAS